MRILALGIDIAPTLATACAALPPKGARFALGRPCSKNLAPVRPNRGFTLLELLVVVAIMALATAGVGFALRDSAAGDLERDAQRLAALLESARAQSRMSGNPVRWHATSTGFRFDGLPGSTLPDRWLASDTLSPAADPITLGPDPIIGAQNIRLLSLRQPDRSLSLVTDGVRPFSVAPGVPDPAVAR